MHHAFYVTVQLRQGVTKGAATETLVRYLADDIQHGKASIPVEDKVLHGLRGRDFWALALSSLSGVVLSMGEADDEVVRDSKIIGLLRLFGVAAKRPGAGLGDAEVEH